MNPDAREKLLKNPQEKYQLYCARTNCKTLQGVETKEEYVIDYIVGRKWVKRSKVYQYYTKWRGYALDQCTLEPAAKFAKKFIDKFDRRAEREGLEMNHVGLELLPEARILEFAEGSI